MNIVNEGRGLRTFENTIIDVEDTLIPITMEKEKCSRLPRQKTTSFDKPKLVVFLFTDLVPIIMGIKYHPTL